MTLRHPAPGLPEITEDPNVSLSSPSLLHVPRVGPGHPFPLFPALVHSPPHLLLFFYFSHFPFLICLNYFLLLSIPSHFLPE